MNYDEYITAMLIADAGPSYEEGEVIPPKGPPAGQEMQGAWPGLPPWLSDPYNPPDDDPRPQMPPWYNRSQPDPYTEPWGSYKREGQGT